MNGIKGLLYKEFLLKRKMYLTGALMVTLMFILTASAALSADFGNLANMENYDPKTASILAYMTDLMIMAYLLISSNNAEANSKSLWRYCEWTLPISPKKTAAVKIIFEVISAAAAMIFALINTAVIYGLSHLQFGITQIKDLTAMLLAAVIFSLIYSLFIYKYRDVQTAATRIFGFAAVLYVLAMIYLYKRLKDIAADNAALSYDEQMDLLFANIAEKYAELRDMLFPFALLLFAAVLAIGYMIFTALMKRREN